MRKPRIIVRDATAKTDRVVVADSRKAGYPGPQHGNHTF